MTFEIPDYSSPLSTDKVDPLPQTLGQKTRGRLVRHLSRRSHRERCRGRVRFPHQGEPLGDMLALTWDFRTFSEEYKIKQFLIDRLAQSKLENFRLKDELLGLQQSYPDLVWIT